MKCFLPLVVAVASLASPAAAQGTSPLATRASWADLTEKGHDVRDHAGPQAILKGHCPACASLPTHNRLQHMRANSAAAKTTGNASRLIGYYLATYDSALQAFVPQDSARYRWSGDRGVDPTVDEEWYDTEDYDTTHILVYVGGPSSRVPALPRLLTVPATGSR